MSHDVLFSCCSELSANLFLALHIYFESHVLQQLFGGKTLRAQKRQPTIDGFKSEGKCVVVRIKWIHESYT